MPIAGYDHTALPAADPEALIAFYKRLGCPTIGEEQWRAGDYPIFAIQIGPNAKLNFHDPKLWHDPKFDLKGPTAKPGCGDLCFLFEGTIDEAEALIREAGGEIVREAVDQTGGGDRGERLGTSVYTRDPDGNLVELMTYPAAGRGGWSD